MLKTLLPVFLGMCLLLVWQPVPAASIPSRISSLNEPAVAKPDPLNDLLVEQFLNLTPKKYYALTGKKMSLPQKISLKLAQHKVKRMIKKGKPVNLVAMSKEFDTSDFNVAGFFLGLILNLIGVLIAYLVGDESMIKWAWVGAGIQAVLILLALIISI